MNNYGQYNNQHADGDRFFFFPFLTGALLGGAAVAVARPRPYGAPVQIYQQPYPYMYPGYNNMGYTQVPYGYNMENNYYSYYN